jgi:hypothetical protein
MLEMLVNTFVTKPKQKKVKTADDDATGSNGRSKLAGSASAVSEPIKAAFAPEMSGAPETAGFGEANHAGIGSLVGQATGSGAVSGLPETAVFGGSPSGMGLAAGEATGSSQVNQPVILAVRHGAAGK